MEGPRTEPFPLLHISYNYDASRRTGLHPKKVMAIVSTAAMWCGVNKMTDRACYTRPSDQSAYQTRPPYFRSYQAPIARPQCMLICSGETSSAHYDNYGNPPAGLQPVYTAPIIPTAVRRFIQDYWTGQSPVLSFIREFIQLKTARLYRNETVSDA